eukprot:SAG11_NODE_1618_length_4571_cov_11.714733_6_plen_80_part_00
MDADGQPYPAGRFFQWNHGRRVPRGGKLLTSCSYNILYGHDIITTSKLGYIDRVDLRPWSTAGGSRSARSGKSPLVDTS